MGNIKTYRATYLWIAVLAAGFAACGDDEDTGPAAGDDASIEDGGMVDGATPSTGMDSGMDAATPVTGNDSGVTPITPIEPVVCGGDTCTITGGAAMLGVTPCCTEADTCGGMSTLAPGCIELGQPGGVDSTCPGFDVMGFLTWGGCCTPDGQCGALNASEGGFGCIPNADLGAPESTCSYDETNNCSRIMEVNCDGPEDCPGQQCCAQYTGGYQSFTCEDDCVALTAGGDIWSEICHPGESCSPPLVVDGGMGPMLQPDGGVIEYECRMNTMFLPDFWYRCRDTGEIPTSSGSTAAGEINCGDSVCGMGEKCCFGLPDEVAHCISDDQGCTCRPGSDGADGGTENDAG